MAYANIRPRRGTLYEWSTHNPILWEGELAVEYPETGIGTGLCKFKIGNGILPYNELPYAFDGASASSILGGTVDKFNLIQLRSGTQENWELANPVLALNELAYDSTAGSLKVGDGVTAWKDLPYISAVSSDDVMDFGDEDAIEEDNTATLKDLV